MNLQQIRAKVWSDAAIRVAAAITCSDKTAPAAWADQILQDFDERFKEIPDDREEVNRLKKTIRQRYDDITALKFELEQCEGKLEKAQEDLAEAEDHLREERENHQATINRLEQIIKDGKAENKRQAEMITQVQGWRAEMDAENRKLTQEIRHISAQRDDLHKLMYEEGSFGSMLGKADQILNRQP